MATDVRNSPGMMGDWKVKVLAGLFLAIVGFVGLAGWLPIGWGLPEQWLTSTFLFILGLGVMMYGFANIT